MPKQTKLDEIEKKLEANVALALSTKTSVWTPEKVVVVAKKIAKGNTKEIQSLLKEFGKKVINEVVEAMREEYPSEKHTQKIWKSYLEQFQIQETVGEWPSILACVIKEWGVKEPKKVKEG